MKRIARIVSADIQHDTVQTMYDDDLKIQLNPRTVITGTHVTLGVAFTTSENISTRDLIGKEITIEGLESAE